MTPSSEPLSKKINRVALILKILKKTYPESATSLNYRNPIDLLVATILSAQCTDDRVNKVTKVLFKKYKTANDYAHAVPEQFQNEIKSTGFYHVKSKNIINCCSKIVKEYRGKVPATMEELIQLPGVGRKTANVVLGNYFNIAAGIVVDTHVKRISKRLNFTKQNDPGKVEFDLINLIRKKDWISTANIFIRHGRNICKARKPICAKCPIYMHCPSSLK
jgi:endonuclease III